MKSLTDLVVARATPSPSTSGSLASRRRAAGVTLIELMVVVIVIGILGLIAIPSYREYVRRSNRTEAKTALLRLATNQERFYLQNRTYTTDLTKVGFANPGESERGVYVITIPVANIDTFTATATPKPGGGPNGVDMTEDTECASFSLNAQGVRTSAPKIDCW
jgi:type IV pilus assembly protein PilE